MQRSDVDTLVDYMYWVNGRLLDVEWSWRLNLQNRLAEDEAELNPADFPDVASLRERWEQDEAEMRAWLGTLDDGDLTAEVASTFTRDRRPLWLFLVHILTHAAQQQADAATLLTAAGHSPGEIGFIAYLHASDAMKPRRDTVLFTSPDRGSP